MEYRALQGLPVSSGVTIFSFNRANERLILT